MSKNSSKKRIDGLVHRMSKDIKGLALAHAFKVLQSNGLRLRIAEYDGEKRPTPVGERDPERINVQVDGGYVTRCWIG